MHWLGVTLVVVAALGWVVGGNAIIGPQRLRRGERPLLFELRPPPRLSELTPLQKRKLSALLVAVVVVSLPGLALAGGGFDHFGR